VSDLVSYVKNPGSFRDGVDLYRAHGDGTDLRLFEKALKQKYVSSDIKERLLNRLKSLVPASTDLRSRSEGGQKKKGGDLRPSTFEPEVVTQLRHKGRKLKKEESYYHAQLVTMAQQPESKDRKTKLYELASAIMEIEYELDDIYGQIRRYEEKGDLPIDNRRQLINEVVEKMKRRDSIRPRIYRIKKELKKDLEHIDRQKYEQELAEKEAELKKIEDELNL